MTYIKHRKIPKLSRACWIYTDHFLRTICAHFFTVYGEQKKGLSVWSEKAPIGDDKKPQCTGPHQPHEGTGC